MNRQQRRNRQRKNKKMQGRSNKRVNQVEYNHIMSTFNIAKMVSMLVLRDNKGYGKQRLEEFSDSFDDLLKMLSDGYLSSVDISSTIEKETGLKVEDFRIR